LNAQRSSTTESADPRRWWALGALTLRGLVFNIDTTVLNLALPTLSSSLHASTAQLQWFVAAYTLVMAAVMLPGGLLGDRFGRKRFLVLGMAVFGVASLACAYAPSPAVFIAARSLAGLAAGFTMPLGLAMVRTLFDESELATATAVLMGATMVAAPVGPLLGGWLLAHFWWGSVFLINVPIVALGLVGAMVFLPETPVGRRGSFDGVGVVTSSVGLVAVVYGVIEAGQRGWLVATAFAPLAGGLLVLAAFVLWEVGSQRRERRGSLVDLRLFGSAGFTWGTILLTLMTFAMFGVTFIAPQFFQAVRGLGPQATAVRFLTLTVGVVVGSTIGTQVLPRLGTRIAVGLGFGLLAAGLLTGAATGVGAGDVYALGWMTVVGVAVGFVMPAANAVALAALPRERAGSGSALLTTGRMVGGTFGVAILGSILNAGYKAHLSGVALPPAAAGTIRQSVFGGIRVAQQTHSAALLDAVRAAFMGGMDTTLVVCAAIALAGALLAITFLPRYSKANETASPDGGAA
jgi:MFS transporter, DHA2 family, multidrug resistance protein